MYSGLDFDLTSLRLPAEENQQQHDAATTMLWLEEFRFILLKLKAAYHFFTANKLIASKKVLVFIHLTG